MPMSQLSLRSRVSTGSSPAATAGASAASQKSSSVDATTAAPGKSLPAAAKSAATSAALSGGPELSLRHAYTITSPLPGSCTKSGPPLSDSLP